MSRQLYADAITRTHQAASDDDCHDARLAHKQSVRIAPQHRLHQTWRKAVDLGARVPQTRDFNNGVAEAKARPDGQPEQIELPRGDVFPELAGGNRVSLGAELLEQLGMDQMNLPEVGLGWIASHARSVFTVSPA